MQNAYKNARSSDADTADLKDALFTLVLMGTVRVLCVPPTTPTASTREGQAIFHLVPRATKAAAAWILSCVDEPAPFQCGKRLDGFSYLLPGEPEVVEALEIQPKLSTRAKEMSEAQGGVARDGARSVQDLRDAIGRHVDLSRQFSRAHIECLQFFSQVFTWMDSSESHSDAPSDSQQSPRLMAQALGQPIRSKFAIDR